MIQTTADSDLAWPSIGLIGPTASAAAVSGTTQHNTHTYITFAFSWQHHQLVYTASEDVGLVLTYYAAVHLAIHCPVQPWSRWHMIKVGQVLQALFSHLRKSAVKIVEPWHTANFTVGNFVWYWLHEYTIADRKNDTCIIFSPSD